MKWPLKVLFCLLLLSGPALGQAFTTVSGVAKDGQNNVFQNCTYNINFVGQSVNPGPYLLNGSVFQQNYAGVRCDGFGNFSIRLPSNSAIQPQPSSWQFNFCDSSGHFCNAAGSLVITIAGVTQDISALLTPLLPILPPPGNAVASVFGRTGQVVAMSGDYTVAQITGAAPQTSPIFSGTPTGPTPSVGTFNNQLATTAFVVTAIGNAIGGGGGGGGGWNPPANTPGNTIFGNNAVGTGTPSFFIPGGDVSFSSGQFSVNSLHFGTTSLNLTNTGIATGNCLQVSGSNIIGGACGTGGGGGAVTSVFGRTGVIAAQANDYSVSQVTGAAGLASPIFTGNPQGPTPATTDNSTSLATTAWVKAQGYGTGGGGGGNATGLIFNGTTIPLGSPAPTAGQFLTYNGTSIVGGTPSGGGGGGLTGCATATSGELVCDVSVQGGIGPTGMLTLPYASATLPAAPTAPSVAGIIANGNGVFWSPGNGVAFAQLGVGGGGGTTGVAHSLTFGTSVIPISTTPPSSGEILVFDGTTISAVPPSSIGGGGGGGGPLGGVTIID